MHKQRLNLFQSSLEVTMVSQNYVTLTSDEELERKFYKCTD